MRLGAILNTNRKTLHWLLIYVMVCSFTYYSISISSNIFVTSGKIIGGGLYVILDQPLSFLTVKLFLLFLICIVFICFVFLWAFGFVAFLGHKIWGYHCFSSTYVGAILVGLYAKTFSPGGLPVTGSFTQSMIIFSASYLCLFFPAIRSRFCGDFRSIYRDIFISVIGGSLGALIYFVAASLLRIIGQWMAK